MSLEDKKEPVKPKKKRIGMNKKRADVMRAACASLEVDEEIVEQWVDREEKEE